MLAQMCKERAGIARLRKDFEYRFPDGTVVEDSTELELWRDRLRSGQIFTGERFGGRPVFLCKVGEPVPLLLEIDGVEVVQHAELTDYWAKLAQEVGWVREP